MKRLLLFAAMVAILIGLAMARMPEPSISAGGNALTTASSISSRPSGARSLCHKGEQVLFSCTMKKSGKLLSLCGSEQLDSQKGYVQYRFGRREKIELEFPSSTENTQAAFRYLRYTRPRVTYLVVRFESNGYLYSVHDDDNSEEGTNVDESYLTITTPKATGEPTTLRCQKPVSGSLIKLEDVVPRSEDDNTEP